MVASVRQQWYVYRPSNRLPLHPRTLRGNDCCLFIRVDATDGGVNIIGKREERTVHHATVRAFQLFACADEDDYTAPVYLRVNHPALIKRQGRVQAILFCPMLLSLKALGGLVLEPLYKRYQEMPVEAVKFEKRCRQMAILRLMTDLLAPDPEA